MYALTCCKLQVADLYVRVPNVKVVDLSTNCEGQACFADARYWQRIVADISLFLLVLS